MSIQELLIETAQLIAILLGLSYVLPAVKSWLLERRAEIISDQLRIEVLTLIKKGKETYSTNRQVYEWVRNRLRERYPSVDIEELEGHVLLVLDMLEKNLDVSNYISRRTK